MIFICLKSFTLCQRFVRTASPLPTTTRCTHCFQVGDYAKISVSTTRRRCRPGLTRVKRFTRFPVNAARCTSERLEDPCKTELRSTIETSDSPVPRPPPFQSMPTTPDTSHSGRKLSLLIVTLINTRAGSERQFI